MDPENDCSICYENFVANDLEKGDAMKERLEVDGCDHAFCRECLADHCKVAISSREIPIRCPASGSEKCTNVLKEDQVKTLLCDCEGEDGSEKAPSTYGSIGERDKERQDGLASGKSHWTEFQRFLRKLQDPTLISCTRCDELFSSESPRVQRTHSNDVSCPFCKHEFCAVHGDSHLMQSCAVFKPVRNDAKSEKAIRRFTKPCSHCGIPIHKESGCDHIVCGSCREDFCFKCGSHEYLTGEMMRSCSKCEQTYIDHRFIWRYRITLCLSLPIYIPVCILHIALMAILATATCGCFCFLGCGVKVVPPDDNETVSRKGTEKVIFRPLLGMRTVLAIVFLPIVDLMQQCGMPCCCAIEIPGIEGTGTSEARDDDLSDDSAGER